MHRRIRCVFTLVFLSIFIQLSVCSTTVVPDDLSAEENEDSNGDEYLVTSSRVNEKRTTTTTTTTTAAAIEEIESDILDNVTDPKTTITTTVASTTISTSVIINAEEKKEFLTEHLLNVNRSSPFSADAVFNNYLNHSTLLIADDHEILLINKKDGTLEKHFKYANLVAIHQENKEPSQLLAVYDDNTQQLWIYNSTDHRSVNVPFKPKTIHILSPNNNLWLAETTDQVALYLSENSGFDWKKIDDSSSSSVLGWSSKANSAVINQHSRFVKLLDLTTSQTTPILTDVSSTKLFSRYLLAKRSNTEDAVAISHVNNLADGNFRSLPQRLQSKGNFYCAVEDTNTEDLLLLFTTESQTGENNETIPSTCNLIGYARQDPFNLSNIDCRLKSDGNPSNTIECSNNEIPFYQVRGLMKRVYLANVAPGPSTLISLDGGATWNKTHFECNTTDACPNNVSLVINSLISSNEAPGMIVGKATNGINEYVAVSSNGGRTWRLTNNSNGDQIAISNPNALIVMVPRDNQLSQNHVYRYSTDYGRHWHQGTFLNDSSIQKLFLAADNNNIFYLLTSNGEGSFNLLELDFNALNLEQCSRHQVKEWTLHNSCVNGSKSFYKRRISGAHCLNNISEIRQEPCACSLADFECSPGYRRGKDGTCTPRSHYIYSQDCACHTNSSLSTKRRGYVKSGNSQCKEGVEDYLSDTYVLRRDSQQPNFLIYGNDARKNRSMIEVHTNGFDSHEIDDDEEEEDEHVKNANWFLDPSEEITGIVFDENHKQVYMAVQRDQTARIYRVAKNLREQGRSSRQLVFDPNNEIYKSSEELIEHMALDWLRQNLYLLVRNRKTSEQKILLLDIRTHKIRTISKNQHIQPAILQVDPIKTDLYWITRHSPSIFNIANLQGQPKKQVQLSSADENISYMSYDPVTHEIIYIIGSNIYGLNTLNRQQLSPRLIYEHSSVIKHPLFSHPVLHFTDEHNDTEKKSVALNAIDVVAKSFAKNTARLKEFGHLKLLADMVPTMPSGEVANPCAQNPCSDICIALEHGRFRCICGDDARFQSCSCPTDERFIAGGCQTKNDQCAPGRVLCQNRLNCAESASACEQDHTQYTEAFKQSARCTIEKPDDGFDCYYTGTGIHSSNSTCIPIEWLCDGVYDCPLHNDEDHCHKLTTTTKTPSKIGSRCLTEKKFSHVYCRNKCMKISDVCRNLSNAQFCHEQFHLHCKQTHEKDTYECKCRDQKNRCIAMIEQCDDYDHCERVCKDSVHYANAKSEKLSQPSSIIWIVLVVIILVLLLIAILWATLRYFRQRNKAQQVPAASRTPVVTTETVRSSPPSDVREKLLNNASTNTTVATTANETS